MIDCFSFISMDEFGIEQALLLMNISSRQAIKFLYYNSNLQNIYIGRMLGLRQMKNSLPPSAEREKIEREIAVTDEKIDEIVYGLYGITDKERKITEGR